MQVPVGHGWHSLWFLATCLLCLHLGTPRLLAQQQVVVVILDDSGSMDERMRTRAGRVRRIDAAKRALSQVLSNLPPTTQVGVLTLNTRLSDSNWIVPLGPVSPRAWQANVQSIEARGGTPLGEFIKQGADALLAARSRLVYGTYRLLIVTDGEANDPELIDLYVPGALGRGLILDVIGVDMSDRHSLAARAHSYRSAMDDRSLTQAIAEVFAETSSTDQDSADDFEILAALPDEFASAALEVLTRRNDQPLEAVPVGTDGGTGATGRGNSGTNSGSNPLADVLGMMCCCGALLGCVALVALLSAFRRRR